MGRVANEERRGSVETFHSARSLVTFFPLDFGERSLAEIDKTLKGHLLRAQNFLVGPFQNNFSHNFFLNMIFKINHYL